FFDGFLIVGQTAAAALAAGASLLVLRYLTRGNWRLLAPAAACSALACLLRTEAVIWCVALAGAAVLASVVVPRLRSRTGGADRLVSHGAPQGLVATAFLAGAALLARTADQLLTRHALG